MDIVEAVLLEEILDYLTVLELLPMRLVCKCWQRKVDKVLEVKQKTFCTEIVSLCTKWENAESQTCSSRGNWKIDKGSEIHSSLCTWRQSWQTQPKLALCTCLCSDEKKLKKNFTSETCALFQDWMPPDCLVLAVASIESVVCTESSKRSLERDVEEIVRFYNIMTLSDCPGRLSINVLNQPRRSKRDARVAFRDSVQAEIDDPDLKMLLIIQSVELHLDTGKTKMQKVLSDAINKNIVVIGSLYGDPIMLKSLIQPTGDGAGETSSAAPTAQSMVIVSFKGADAKAASVLLDYCIDTKAMLYAELNRLKATLESFTSGCPEACKSRTPTGYCYSCRTQVLGFMIACCARCDGCLWFDDIEERNAEQEAFRSLLPNIPLLGTYGMGEIGESLNLVNMPKEHVSRDLLKGESTIFSIIMF